MKASQLLATKLRRPEELLPAYWPAWCLQAVYHCWGLLHVCGQGLASAFWRGACCPSFVFCDPRAAAFWAVSWQTIQPQEREKAPPGSQGCSSQITCRNTAGGKPAIASSAYVHAYVDPVNIKMTLISNHSLVSILLRLLQMMSVRNGFLHLGSSTLAIQELEAWLCLQHPHHVGIPECERLSPGGSANLKVPPYLQGSQRQSQSC